MRVVEVVEASTGEPFATVSLAGRAEVDDAVAAAQAALRGPWGRMSAAERAEVMLRFGTALRARGPATAELVSRENGMPIVLSRLVNGLGAAAIIRYYARLVAAAAESGAAAEGAAGRRGFAAVGAAPVPEEVRPSSAGGRHVVRREPVGVVAAITPWNYPQALAAMKIGPALAAGCTVVLKPPPETALDAFAFADAAREAGLPDGVLTVLPSDRDTGEYLVSHPGVAKVAFTGSTAAGRAIAATAGRLLRPVTLELGGKSAAIVLPDADLDAFTASLLDHSLPNNGQTCHACTRILAPRSRYDEIVDAVTSTVSALHIGDPLDEKTQIGPLVSEAQRDRVLSYVDGTDARLTTGGHAVDGPGWFVEPTVFADVDNRSRIAQEEIFGPVLCVIPYGTEDEAVALANDSAYGLGGTVWTADEDHGLDVARRIETGTVGVNHYDLDLAAPFGGLKASGLGRELGPEGMDAYLRLQTIYLR